MICAADPFLRVGGFLSLDKAQALCYNAVDIIDNSAIPAQNNHIWKRKS